MLTYTLLTRRFPGGESYRDLIRRLTSVVIDVEQQVNPTLVVSHVSILQCLMAYFRNTPVDKCMSIEVPMHTIIKFTPVRGGGWLEEMIPLFDESVKAVESHNEITQVTSSHMKPSPSPIWSDNLSFGALDTLGLLFVDENEPKKKL
jgi:broad specificity phosphatase PhoE